MKLTSTSFEHNAPIPAEFAFCARGDDGEVGFAGNQNPALSWDELPAGTRSLVLLCHDPDVPSRPDDVNQEGRTVPADLPREDFYHWVLIDLPPDTSSIEAGEFSSEVTPRGKDGPDTPRGEGRHGINDYTNWFDGDADMGGFYYGYDGPCPPWNDSIVHHYHFTLYALDIPKLHLEDRFTGADVVQAMQDHIIERTTYTGLYSLNPDVPAGGG